MQIAQVDAWNTLGSLRGDYKFLTAELAPQALVFVYFTSLSTPFDEKYNWLWLILYQLMSTH